MAISRKLKQRWERFGGLDELLKITQNLSVSPFGLHEGRADFRGIVLRGCELEFDLQDADFSGSLWDDATLKATWDEQALEDAFWEDNNAKDLTHGETAGLNLHRQNEANSSSLGGENGLNLVGADSKNSSNSSLNLAGENKTNLSQKGAQTATKTEPKFKHVPRKITNVIFDDSEFFASSMKMIAGHGAHFTRCGFANCKYRGADFLTASLIGCEFTRIKKSHRLCFEFSPLVKDCTFEGEIHKARFGSANLINCQFKGVLYDCEFDGMRNLADSSKPVTREMLDNQMDGVDFTQAQVICCTFGAFCRLDRVKFSEPNIAFAVTPQFFKRLREIIKERGGEHEERLASWIQTFYSPHEMRPYLFTHPQDFAYTKDELSEAEFSRNLFEAVHQAAIETGAAV